MTEYDQPRADNAQAAIDELHLNGDGHSDEAWERAPFDGPWWRARSLPFPAQPIQGTEFLIPVSSFEHVVTAHQELNIPLDNFWLRSLLSPSWRTCYFFKWSGEISALVLTIFDRTHRELSHVECLAQGDKPVPMPHRSTILQAVIQAFVAAGFDVAKANRKVQKAFMN
jgi:hypothetical protein